MAKPDKAEVLRTLARHIAKQPWSAIATRQKNGTGTIISKRTFLTALRDAARRAEETADAQ